MVLFVGNLNQNTTNKDLEKLFSQFGGVQVIDLVRDNITRRSRGYAYIQMDETANTDRAISSLHNTSYMGKLMIVSDRGPGMIKGASTLPLQKNVPPAPKKLAKK